MLVWARADDKENGQYRLLDLLTPTGARLSPVFCSASTDDADDAVAGSEVESGERWLLSPFCCRERWLIRLRFRGVPAVAEAEAPMWKRFSLERSEAGCSAANMGLAKTATAVFY